MKLEQARTIIATARAHGREQGLKPLTIVVLDAGGHTVAIEREDGASYGRPDVAAGKAAGALALGISSRAIGDMAAERPSFVASLTGVFGGRIVPAAGGVLVRDGEGVLVGAVGISGDLSDKDEAAALAGVAAAGLVAG